MNPPGISRGPYRLIGREGRLRDRTGSQDLSPPPPLWIFPRGPKVPPFPRWTFPRGHKVLPPPPALTFPGGPKVTPLRPPPPPMALPGCSPSVRPPGSSWVLPGPSCAPLVPVGSFCLGPPGSLFLLPAATKMILCCVLRFARIHWSLEAVISRQKATEGAEHSAARQIQGRRGV